MDEIKPKGPADVARRSVKRTVTRVERAEISLSRYQLERVIADALGMSLDSSFEWYVDETSNTVESLKVIQETETAMETPYAG